MGWSKEAIDFMNGCLSVKPRNRLGFNGFNEFKNHPWYKKFNWDEFE